LRKNIIYVAICLFYLLSCNSNKKNFWSEIKLKQDDIYIVFRGTDTKQGFFARDFNIKDTLSSHVGLLLFDKNNWFVYNVSDFKDNLSDFRKQSIEDFFDLEEEKISSASLWKIELDSSPTKHLSEILKEYESLNIKFDKYFTLKDSSKLYCSQFMKEVLFQIDSVKFNIKTRKRELKGIYKTYFQKDTLEYYPVDVFQLNKNIKKIKEWSFK